MPAMLYMLCYRASYEGDEERQQRHGGYATRERYDAPARYCLPLYH